MKFHLLRMGTMLYWWEDAGHQYLNSAGGGFQKVGGRGFDEIVERVEAECYEDLDHKKTSLWKPESDTGWLSPTGEFYGCSYADHDRLAELVLKTAVCELEKTGWIRVPRQRAVLYCDLFPTDAQRDWARDHGHPFGGEHEEYLDAA